jgi:hypothetical protein
MTDYLKDSRDECVYTELLLRHTTSGTSREVFVAMTVSDAWEVAV